jgi:hypothetical protein
MHNQNQITMRKVLFLAMLPIVILLGSCGSDEPQVLELRVPIIIRPNSINELIASRGIYEHVVCGVALVGQGDKKDPVLVCDAVLLRFNQGMFWEDVVLEMASRGLRPATDYELRMLKDTHPLLWKKVSVATLDPITPPASNSFIFWDGSWKGRKVHLEYRFEDWGWDTCFLAFQKQASV